MNIIIAGGTGFIGKHLCQELSEREHKVTVLTRNASKARNVLPTQIHLSEWDCLNWGSLESTLSGSDAVINLAGEPIAEGRWTPSRKEQLRSSRIDTTRMIVNAMSNLPLTVRPRVLINASGIGYYGLDETKTVDELSKAGNGFLAALCVEWEAEALRATDYGLRTVCLRTGMVLGQDGGALPKMLLPFRLFLGGPIGDGQQPISWIHVKDHVQLIQAILEHDSYRGPINAVSPHPVTMKEFCIQLGKVLGRPSWLPVPRFALKLGLGELSTLMTHGQRVDPLMAQKLGFTFQYPKLPSALSEILEK
ncbi:TIGR01777 family oxidoreductase [Candidatus Nitronereus thalassa]|uniref:TIGR01777 family oxidoreductase n=1 Tax=Candidatus Nitronereus thalassa TaxID=3020898 RepID=A0ABU3K805_9BACT|nr:TIGR01777 family oxidoreductase [Candidatus Nitronereus thalassa]MDT7042515.1 TIGR01777 family oxidoreductase [Candidatus Nitronereus thalassa]